MTDVEKLRRILRKDEYEAAEKAEQTLNESVQQLYHDIAADRSRANIPIKRFGYAAALAKEVLIEAVSDLYIHSLIIDEPEKYSNSLRAGMRQELSTIMESANTMRDLKAMFENASPYIKDCLVLAEAIAVNKPDEEVEAFKKDVILTPDDKKLIDDFESESGMDTYADELQNRVVEVYKKEQELGEDRKNKVQNIISQLAEIEEKKKAKENEANKGNDAEEKDPLTESVERGINMFGTMPTTIFNSIFMNKSKMVMNESTEGTDLASNAEEILAETICTYTLLECIHALGIKTYTDEDKRALRTEFFLANA